MEQTRLFSWGGCYAVTWSPSVVWRRYLYGGLTYRQTVEYGKVHDSLDWSVYPLD